MATIQLTVTRRIVGYALAVLAGMSERFKNTWYALETVKRNTAGMPQNTDVTVNVEVDALVEIYRKAATIDEGVAYTINSDVKFALIPQMQPLAKAQETARQTVLAELAAIEQQEREANTNLAEGETPVVLPKPVVPEAPVKVALDQMFAISAQNSAKLEVMIEDALR